MTMSFYKMLIKQIKVVFVVVALACLHYVRRAFDHNYMGDVVLLCEGCQACAITMR